MREARAVDNQSGLADIGQSKFAESTPSRADTIEEGAFPEWEFAVQLFSAEDAEAFPLDHLDSTKLIPEEMVPLRVIGRMVLDRWPENFFAETEQVAFCPSHILPGMDFSNDPLLQSRLFSYFDT